MKKLYSKILLAFVFCFCFLRAGAQWVNIPDANFVSWLNANGYASCMNGNLMDTTCSTIINEDTLYYISNNIYDLTGIQYFDNLTYLGCSQNNLTSLPPLPSTLIYLQCLMNQLTTLPTLPPSLFQLDCRWNQLTNLPALPNTLWSLNCDHNFITSLPTLSNSLWSLRCSYNQISTLPVLPNLLIFFYCDMNQLISLPALPSSLNTLSCFGNQLSGIPVLPNSLSTLEFSGNPIVAFPTLPNSLYRLGCSSIQLSFLPPLPNSLIELNCANNQLTSLPTLPSSLTELHCENNQLTSLPALPNTIYDLYCHDNLLTTLPELPDSLDQLRVHNNFNLHCLPELKYVNTLVFTNTDIQCLPNYGNVINSSPLLSSLPLCDLFNANGCDVYWNISGKVYEDSSNNCIAEPNEVRLSNFKILLDSAGTLIQQTYTGGEGLYSFDTDTGTYTYTVDTIGLPVLVTCPVSGFQTSVLTALDSMDYGMDFGMQCKPGFDVGVTSVVGDSGVFRPANFAKIKIAAGDISNFFGLHCAAGTSGAVEVILGGPVTYVSAAAGSLVPVVSGDTLLYSIADFGTVNFNSDFRFVVQTDTTAMVGQQICFSVNVTPVTGDLNVTNNSLQHCFMVVSSFDPNNKEVFPEGNIDTSQHWLTYTINFQNTGTAPAQHIYILDTLDTDFDESTFTLLSYSHNPLTQVVGNTVRFNFPNINLPDSVSDEPNSHGYVQFKAKLKNSLPFGTIIENTTHIIFDFNAPVVTNTTVNEIVNLTSSPTLTLPGREGIALYPNPVTDGNLKIIFQSKQNTTAAFELFDISGRKVFSKVLNLSGNSQTIKLPELSAGMYQCVVSYSQNRMSRKLAIVK